jgi:molybdopterin biosynthesis enzyme
VAAYIVFRLVVAPLLCTLGHLPENDPCCNAVLCEALPSNHGRTECVPISLADGSARPIRMKSGLISLLSQAQGYVIIPRNSEGISAGTDITVHLFN